MRIKYTLVYEWEDSPIYIESYMEDNRCSEQEAIGELIGWNKEQFAERLETRAANILSDYNTSFKYEIIKEK